MDNQIYKKSENTISEEVPAEKVFPDRFPAIIEVVRETHPVMHFSLKKMEEDSIQLAAGILHKSYLESLVSVHTEDSESEERLWQAFTLTVLERLKEFPKM